MTGLKKLGVFWGDSGLFFLEVQKDVPLKGTAVLFSDLQRQNTEIASISEDARLLEHIQRNCRNAGFSTVDAYLSLPSRDIVLRWFTIPMMRPTEVAGVVAFEARKHLPFALEQVIYNYYSSPITQAGTKQIGIVFVGIKKDIYQRYTRVLSQAGFHVVFTEPSCMSMLRAVVLKKIVTSNAVTAILHIERDRGEIFIAANGVVTFVRDFHFAPSDGTETEVFAVIKEKMFNEARISLDFFHRQSDADVGRLILLNSSDIEALGSGFSDDLGIPVLPVDPGVVTGAQEIGSVGYLGAFGAALSGGVPSVIDINLSEEDGRARNLKSNVSSYKLTYLVPVVVGILAGLILAGIWIVTNQMLETAQSELNAVTEQLGTYSDIAPEDISAKRDRASALLKSFKKLELHSESFAVIVKIVRCLPENAWVDSIRITYSNSPGKVQDDGVDLPKYIRSVSAGFRIKLFFTDNRNRAFDAGYKLIRTIRENPAVMSVFNVVKLNTLTLEDAENGVVVNLDADFK